MRKEIKTKTEKKTFELEDKDFLLIEAIRELTDAIIRLRGAFRRA